MNIENNQISMIYSPEGQIATGFFSGNCMAAS